MVGDDIKVSLADLVVVKNVRELLELLTRNEYEMLANKFQHCGSVVLIEARQEQVEPLEEEPTGLVHFVVVIFVISQHTQIAHCVLKKIFSPGWIGKNRPEQREGQLAIHSVWWSIGSRSTATPCRRTKW